MNEPGYTLWIRAAKDDIDVPVAAEAIAETLRLRWARVEHIDAAGLAYALYSRRQSGVALQLALSMTADALTRHGVACVIAGGAGSAHEFAWGRRKPERLLDIVLAGEGDAPQGRGPFIVLRPATSIDDPPDPPTSQPVPGTPAAERTPADSDKPADGRPHPDDENRVVWNLAPLLEALEKAGWIPPGADTSSEDDDLIRKRLRDLGYL